MNYCSLVMESLCSWILQWFARVACTASLCDHLLRSCIPSATCFVIDVWHCFLFCCLISISECCWGLIVISLNFGFFLCLSMIERCSRLHGYNRLPGQRCRVLSVAWWSLPWHWSSLDWLSVTSTFFVEPWLTCCLLHLWRSCPSQSSSAYSVSEWCLYLSKGNVSLALCFSGFHLCQRSGVSGIA